MPNNSDVIEVNELNDVATKERKDDFLEKKEEREVDDVDFVDNYEEEEVEYVEWEDYLLLEDNVDNNEMEKEEVEKNEREEERSEWEEERENRRMNREEEMRVEQQVRHNICYELLMLSGEYGMMENQKELEKEMSRRGMIHMNRQAYLEVCVELLEKNEVDKAIKMISIIHMAGMDADRGLFVAIINHYLKRGEIEKAHSIKIWMEASGHPLFVFEFNNILKGHVDKEDWMGAELLLEEMKRKGVMADVATHMIIIIGYAQRGSEERMKERIEEMIREGIAMTEWMFTTILKSLANVGRMKEAQYYFEKSVIMFGLQPTMEIYNTMIHGWGRMNRFKQAIIIMTEMEKKREEGLMPTEQTYTLIIQTLMQHKKVELANVMKEEMEMKGMTLMPSLARRVHYYLDKQL